VRKCDLVACGQQVLLIIWCVARKFLSNRAPWRWCQHTPKCIAATIVI